MKKEKSLKSPLKSLIGVFLISILSIFVYFFFSSKIALIEKTVIYTQKIASITASSIVQEIENEKEQYIRLFHQDSIPKNNPLVKKLYSHLKAVKSSDSIIDEAFIIQYKKNKLFILLSSTLEYGEVKTIETPSLDVIKGYIEGGNALGFNIHINPGGKDIKETTPSIFPIKTKSGKTAFAVGIKLKIESIFSIIKKDFIGNLLAIFIILGICITLALFFIRRIVKGENKIKEQLNSSNLLLSEKNREIIASISYAKRIQEAYLPTQEIFKHYFPESFLIFKPKDIVSGDFYWFYSPKEKRNKTIYVAAADCTGHGVPGAIMSVICCDALNEAVIDLGITETNLVLDKARELIIQNLKSSKEGNQKDGMDITFCKIDKENQTIEFSAANNPLWLLRNGEIQEFKADKQPVGIHRKMESFTKSVINYQQGDIIYLSSDGYADQFGGEKNKKFKSSNMKKLILSIASESMDKQGKIMSEQFEDWKGNNEQIDDVCVLGIKF